MKKKTRPKNCCTSNFLSTCWIWRQIWSSLEDVKDCMLASTLVPGHKKEKENICLLALRSTSFSLGGVLQEGWKLLNYILPAFNTSSIYLVEHNVVQRAQGYDLVILWGYCRSTGWPSNLTASSKLLAYVWPPFWNSCTLWAATAYRSSSRLRSCCGSWRDVFEEFSVLLYWWLLVLEWVPHGWCRGRKSPAFPSLLENCTTPKF